MLRILSREISSPTCINPLPNTLNHQIQVEKWNCIPLWPTSLWRLSTLMNWDGILLCYPGWSWTGWYHWLSYLSLLSSWDDRCMSLRIAHMPALTECLTGASQSQPRLQAAHEPLGNGAWAQKSRNWWQRWWPLMLQAMGRANSPVWGKVEADVCVLSLPGP